MEGSACLCNSAIHDRAFSKEAYTLGNSVTVESQSERSKGEG